MRPITRPSTDAMNSPKPPSSPSGSVALNSFLARFNSNDKRGRFFRPEKVGANLGVQRSCAYHLSLPVAVTLYHQFTSNFTPIVCPQFCSILLGIYLQFCWLFTPNFVGNLPPILWVICPQFCPILLVIYPPILLVIYPQFCQ